MTKPLIDPPIDPWQQFICLDSACRVLGYVKASNPDEADVTARNKWGDRFARCFPYVNFDHNSQPHAADQTLLEEAYKAIDLLTKDVEAWHECDPAGVTSGDRSHLRLGKDTLAGLGRRLYGHE